MDDTKGGDDVVILEGTAELLDGQDISTALPEYVEKYGTMMQDLGYNPLIDGGGVFSGYSNNSNENQELGIAVCS